MTEPVLLDTCAAIWLMEGAPISAPAREAIRFAQLAHAGVFVSPITAWEIAMLVAKSRIQLSRSPGIWFESLLELPGMRLALLSPEVLGLSEFLCVRRLLSHPRLGDRL